MAQKSFETKQGAGTGLEQAERQLLCVKNCGFFGSASTLSMCTDCYRSFLLQRSSSESSVPIPQGENSGSVFPSPSPLEGTSIAEEKGVSCRDRHTHEDVSLKGFEAGPSSQSGALKAALDECSVQASSPGAAEERSSVKKRQPNRCLCCRKRVGLTGFGCRCGGIFCSLHRYADMHSCSFDYKAAGREAIAKANPVIRAKKIDKI